MQIGRINKTDSKTNYAFMALKISYDAQSRLHHVSDNFINDILASGKKLENTQYYDLQMFGDLSFRIKEKANRFFRIKEPIKTAKTDKHNIKISGVYDGVNDETHKKGDNIDIVISYPTPSKAKAINSRLKELKGISRLAYITKLLDDSKMQERIIEQPQPLTRDKAVQSLMYNYGDVVV